MPKTRSRLQRWQEAASLMRQGFDEIKDLWDEYQDQLENLPENLRASARGEKLEAINQIDMGSLESVLDEIEQADLPLGFGRD